MKIAFDVSDLCTARADGTTNYTRELLAAMGKLSQDEWHLFAPCPPAGPLPALAQWHASPWPKYWTQFRLPFDLLSVRPDVLFMPIQQLPVLRPRNMKTVAVIHDLAFHYFPQQFRRKDWLLLHVFSAQVAREADHIIAISDTTRRDIAMFYGRSHNVHVVHHGVDHQYFFAPDATQRQAAEHILQAEFSHLGRGYLLYVGQIQPRKNIERLIEAYELYRERGGDAQLVVAGGHGWKQKAIYERAAGSRWAGEITMTGAVANEVLRALYWQAGAFILPSLYEGFGMPVLEAMACGTPVVVSNTSCLPEVAGGAAVLVDPASAEAIVGGIVEAFKSREVLRQKGLARAAMFSWEKTAGATLDIIHAA